MVKRRIDGVRTKKNGFSDSSRKLKKSYPNTDRETHPVKKERILTGQYPVNLDGIISYKP